MKNNKSPGTSGFGADFFKVFWRKLGSFVVRALNHAYSSGHLSLTQSQGVITCIPKENKSRLFLKNWRPITLLNTVYKIGSGSISNRIKSVLDSLISREQTGFIPNRYMGENTRLIYDIMQYTEEHNIPGLLLLIDFEKAFDSLSWDFIKNTLSFFNFGPSIQKWFTVFYQDAKSAVIQCGYLSNFVKISRGCRQGDPLSSYIFILCAEILSLKIKENKKKKIKGITINGFEFKISQFADDTTLILDGSKQSLDETLYILTKYASLSGLNVNYDKTKVVWIGQKKYSSDSIKTKWKLLWNQNTFRMLGVNFHVDLLKMVELNFVEKIESVKKIIGFWKRRILTPVGKITVIKSLLLPILNHLFILLPSPSQNIINELNTLFYDFIWQTNVKIKQSVMVKDYSEGGLRMVNLPAFIKALKLTWLRRLTNDSIWCNVIKTGRLEQIIPLWKTLL
jgi:hypothetical protein